MKYYSLSKILGKKAKYNIIIGERSNGKTTACLERALKRYFENGEQFAYIRRWDEDFKKGRGQSLFNDIVERGVVSELSGGKYTGVRYYVNAWYFTYVDESGKTVKEEEYFCKAFSLGSSEHDKSTSYPKIKTIIFDEFLTRSYYLPDEFVLFMNTLSTIIRQRDDVTIFMLANTVSQYAPYYEEMGLKNIRKMKQGDIDVYTYGESGLRVAVEYCSEGVKNEKRSNVYFAFDNPKLNMIKHGAFELDIYPHLQRKYKQSEIEFIFFIQYVEYLLQCEIVFTGDSTFMFIHQKTTEIKEPDNDIIFTLDVNERPNYFVGFKSKNRTVQKIAWYFKEHLVFYQSNEIGEIVKNYLIDSNNII